MMCSTAFPVIRKSEVGDARSGRDREDLAARYRDGRSIRGISRDLGVSRVTNQKVLRSETTEFVCKRRTPPRPKIGTWRSEFDADADFRGFAVFGPPRAAATRFGDMRLNGGRSRSSVRFRMLTILRVSIRARRTNSAGATRTSFWAASRLGRRLRMRVFATAGCFSSGRIPGRARRWFSTLTRRRSRFLAARASGGPSRRASRSNAKGMSADRADQPPVTGPREGR